MYIKNKGGRQLIPKTPRLMEVKKKLKKICIITWETVNPGFQMRRLRMPKRGKKMEKNVIFCMKK